MGTNKTNKSSKEVKCVIVGDGGVGKTSLLMSYTTGGIMMDYIPTCFDCYTVDMKVQEKCYAMSLIDTAGQETYDRLRTLTYYDTDIFLVCFSVADNDSFENMKSKWVQEIQQYRPKTPYIFVGTQIDKREITADDREECVSTKKGKSAAKKFGARCYLECSALKGEGVADVFLSALQTAIKPATKRKSVWKGIMSSFKSKRSNSGHG